jgi:hypothetical protein
MKIEMFKRQMSGFSLFGILVVGVFTVGVLAVAYFGLSDRAQVVYDSSSALGQAVASIEKENDDTENISLGYVPIRLQTPEPLRAIYMTQCVVGTPSFRDSLVSLIEDTEINAVVIDVKDYSGTIGFPSDNPVFVENTLSSCGAYDMQDFVRRLNEKGIYTIARITVFQDPLYTVQHPELAVKKASATTTNWKDYKGLSFIDVSAKPFWEYIVAISKEAWAIGFDELNFDYIRFPSDGPMRDIYFPWSKDADKQEALEKFFKYLHDQLKPDGAILSADLFGMTMTNTDDLNIGQVLERALPYFDYIAPMVYPSHYPNSFLGLGNPNLYPYEVVNYSMFRGVERTISPTTSVNSFVNEPIFETVTTFASSTGTTTEEVFTGLYTKPVYDKLKLRPWLQDFDYGGNYDVEEVRAQIKATNDAGLTSWMLWSPSNRYTKGALKPFYEEDVATSTSLTE